MYQYSNNKERDIAIRERVIVEDKTPRKTKRPRRAFKKVKLPKSVRQEWGRDMEMLRAISRNG